MATQLPVVHKATPANINTPSDSQSVTLFIRASDNLICGKLFNGTTVPVTITEGNIALVIPAP